MLNAVIAAYRCSAGISAEQLSCHLRCLVGSVFEWLPHSHEGNSNAATEANVTRLLEACGVPTTSELIDLVVLCDPNIVRGEFTNVLANERKTDIDGEQAKHIPF